MVEKILYLKILIKTAISLQIITRKPLDVNDPKKDIALEYNTDYIPITKDQEYLNLTNFDASKFPQTILDFGPINNFTPRNAKFFLQFHKNR